MASILVFSEREELAFELLGQARVLSRPMGFEVVAAVLGQADPKEFQKRGAAKVLYSNHEHLKNFEASVYAQALAQLVRAVDASLILISSTRRGRELAGRLAQKLDAGCLMDVKSLDWKDGKIVCVRNSFGGATEATQRILTKVQVISTMPGAFESAPPGEIGGAVVDLDLDLPPSPLKILKRTEKEGAADIEGAEILVCVGKGLAKKEDLKMIEDLAGALGGVVACTKPFATDLKWLPESRTIGLSGKKGKPRLALCLGISGQVQFTVGIRDAKTIMAINTDPNAYIFQITDYGMVADLHQAVPLLTAALKG